MEREKDIIELGVASANTLGGGEFPLDEDNGQYKSGLSDD